MTSCTSSKWNKLAVVHNIMAEQQKTEEQVVAHLDCCICLHRMTNPCAWMHCQHMACLSCLAPVGARCPMCKQIAEFISLPRNHMLIYQMCGMERGKEEMSTFTGKYNLIAKFRRWTAFGNGGKTKISAERFFGVYRVPDDVLLRVAAIQATEEAHKQTAKAASARAQRARNMAATAKEEWQNVLEQVAGAIP